MNFRKNHQARRSEWNLPPTGRVCSNFVFDLCQKCVHDHPVCVSCNCYDLSDEVDEIEVYGSEAQSGTQLATYSFEVRKKSCVIAFYVNADLSGR